MQERENIRFTKAEECDWKRVRAPQREEKHSRPRSSKLSTIQKPEKKQHCSNIGWNILCVSVGGGVDGGSK